MTLYQLAKEECGNFQGDKSCLGICAEGLLDRSAPATPRDKCVFPERPIQPCRYFEQCVMPLATQPDSAGGRIDGNKRAGWAEARRRYLKARKVMVPVEKMRCCPDCGNPLAKRQRVCATCAQKRRRENQRRLMQERRRNTLRSVSS